MSGVTSTNTVTYSGTIVSFVVPVTGTYYIAAAGAPGGGDLEPGGVSSGGLGGEVSADFALVQGETLDIAVGGAGGSIPFDGGGGGGGGGSFVVLIDGTQQTVLEVAGGGGGGSFGNNGGAGGAQPADTGQGAAGGGGFGGGGGAGFYSSGGNAAPVTGTTAIDYPAGGGQDFAAGLAGGSGEAYYHIESGVGGAGGFGGGGGGGAFGASGGGGGYDGGAPGLGGTSFIAATAIDPELMPGVAAAGEVVIDTPVTCFLAGTRLATPHGEVAVEALCEGDLVTTVEAGVERAQPIRWIGWRRIDVASQPSPALVLPIRIRRDAFAPGVPQRDLLVSPDHAVFTDGVLIPARQLVNHATILQETGLPAVEYFHVELERHALLLSEGLPTESYLDTGNRALFANAGLAILLHPQFTVNAALRCWQTDACAKLAVSEAEVEPVWRRLAARAARLGHTRRRPATTDQPDLRLAVCGRTLRPVLADATRAVFVLPRGVREAWLLSRAAAPSALRPWLEDRRRLGVAVTRIEVSMEAELQALAADHPALSTGWWDAERDAERVWRWTDGEARLTLPPGATRLEVRLIGAMAYPVADAHDRHSDGSSRRPRAATADASKSLL